MSETRTIHVVQDPRFRDHEPPGGHPERPARLAAVESALAAYAPQIVAASPRPAEDDELLRVHRRGHLRQIEDAVAVAPAALDPDTHVSRASLDVARLAAGSAIDLALAVSSGETSLSLAAVRPPGHHAESDRPMGFCLFNNVAVAARALQAQGVGKIAIIDWDVHHGNGTQHSFEDDPSILYISTHQYPYYPGTGAAGECGRDAGAGATLNIPMPAGCGDAEYLGVFQRLVVPALLHFRPEIILLSCGFDAHAHDPLASMEVSRQGYSWMTHAVRAAADEICEGRIAVLLEGGYAESGLAEGTDALLEGLLEAKPAPLPGVVDLEPGSMLRSMVERVVAVHQRFNPSIGAA